MISPTVNSTPLFTSTELYSVELASLRWWMEINAYSLVHTQVCSKPLPFLVTSPAGSSAPVAGSYHLISNGPGLVLCNRIVFRESSLAFTRATITTSDPPTNQWCSLLSTLSTATLNGEPADSVANMLAVMKRLKTLLFAHKAAAVLVSGGAAQTVSTEEPAVSRAGRNAEGVADVPAFTLRMTGLFSASAAIHAASLSQPRL